MKILVGYDGSNASKCALELARDRAKELNAEVLVVTSMVKANENQIEDIRQAERGLEYTKALLEKEGIECDTHLLIRGFSPGEDLVEFAEENRADEIFVGVRRRSKVGKFLIGSTAQYVVLHASCPVATVK
jgi:nucleotide-binding universal stress UspA family protein